MSSFFPSLPLSLVFISFSWPFSLFLHTFFFVLLFFRSILIYSSSSPPLSLFWSHYILVSLHIRMPFLTSRLLFHPASSEIKKTVILLIYVSICFAAKSRLSSGRLATHFSEIYLWDIFRLRENWNKPMTIKHITSARRERKWSRAPPPLHTPKVWPYWKHGHVVMYTWVWHVDLPGELEKVLKLFILVAFLPHMSVRLLFAGREGVKNVFTCLSERERWKGILYSLLCLVVRLKRILSSIIILTLFNTHYLLL